MAAARGRQGRGPTPRPQPKIRSGDHARAVPVQSLRTDVHRPRPVDEAHRVSSSKQERRGSGVRVRDLLAQVRAVRHADAARAAAQRAEAVRVRGVRAGVLALRPPGHAPAHAHRREAVPLPELPVRRVPPRHDHAPHAHARATRAARLNATTAQTDRFIPKLNYCFKTNWCLFRRLVCRLGKTYHIAMQSRVDCDCVSIANLLFSNAAAMSN